MRTPSWLRSAWLLIQQLMAIAMVLLSIVHAASDDYAHAAYTLGLAILFELWLLGDRVARRPVEWTSNITLIGSASPEAVRESVERAMKDTLAHGRSAPRQEARA